MRGREKKGRREEGETRRWRESTNIEAASRKCAIMYFVAFPPSSSNRRTNRRAGKCGAQGTDIMYEGGRITAGKEANGNN